MEINELTHRVIGCAMEVHNNIGNGFQEIIYQRSLAIEFSLKGITFEQEKEMYVLYKGEQVGCGRVDFFIENCLMLEIKAIDKIEDIHKNQAINYLEVYNIADGVLINFGSSSLEFKRVYNKKLITAGKHPLSND
jgi:GxxExxY protein